MGDPITAIALSLALASLSSAGQSDTQPSGSGAPIVHASRIGSNAIVLDGVLSESGWSTASAVSEFTQREPNEGAAATERTEVRVLYDDAALYVGARRYDRSPDSVMAQLARRDRIVSADRFIMFLDSYRDRRTASSSGSMPEARCTTGPCTTTTGIATRGTASGKEARHAILWGGPPSSESLTPSFDSSGRRPTGGASTSSGRSRGVMSVPTWSAPPATGVASSRGSWTWSASRR